MRRLKKTWGLTHQVIKAWSDDNIASMGAALAYYTVFSLAPLLLMLVTVAGLAYDNNSVQNAMLDQFGQLIGPNGAEAIRAILNGAQNPHEGTLSLIIGAVTLFIGATTVFAELQHDIDVIWKTPKKNVISSGMWGLLKVRLLSFALIIGVGFLLIVSLVVSTGIAAMSTLWGSWMLRFEILLQIINFFISTTVITVLFALIFKVLPSTPIAWRDVWLGALVTALLFSLGKFAIGLYIGKSAIASSFGAAGALVVLLVWIYYSAQIFLLGTEFTYVYACMHGSRRNTAFLDDSLPATNNQSDTNQSNSAQGNA